MSNNYYAQFTLGDARGWSSVHYKMHIGKATWGGKEIGYGLSTISGKHFPDVDSWVKFLRHNIDCVKIIDETDVEIDVEEFIEEFLLNPKPTSANQIQWLRDNIGNSWHSEDFLKIWDEPQPEAWRARHWIDKATGKLFYSGEFS